MARLLRIQRAIRWMAKTLTANRDALPFPAGITDQINPVIDVFGSQRIGEVQFEIVLGGVGNLEVTHGPIEAETVRQYLSMQYESDDAAGVNLVAGRVVPTGAGFPFAAMADEVTAPGNRIFAVRNFTVPPLGFAAVQADAMAAGAQMTLTLLWIDTPLGEYLRSIE